MGENLEKFCYQIVAYYSKLLISVQETIKNMLSSDMEKIKKEIIVWNTSSSKCQNLHTVNSFSEIFQSEKSDSDEKLH